MRSDYTDITVVLDRSGSIQVCRVPYELGLNNYIREQQGQPGLTRFTCVQFDTQYDVVCNNVPVKQVPYLTIVPRGMTALYDAVGRAIVETGERLRNIAESERPGLVCFVILTDGYENASHEYKREQIKEMIEHQQNIYNWQFTYLGANQDAFAVAADMGINRDSTILYRTDKAEATFTAASANTTRMRSQTMSGHHVNNSYTEVERRRAV